MMFASKGFFFISHGRMNLYTHFLEKSTYFFLIEIKASINDCLEVTIND